MVKLNFMATRKKSTEKPPDVAGGKGPRKRATKPPDVAGGKGAKKKKKK